MRNLIILSLIVLAMVGCGPVGKTRAQIEHEYIPYAKPVSAMIGDAPMADGSVLHYDVRWYRDSFPEFDHGTGTYSTVNVLYKATFRDGTCVDLTWDDSISAGPQMALARP